MLKRIALSEIRGFSKVKLCFYAFTLKSYYYLYYIIINYHTIKDININKNIYIITLFNYSICWRNMTHLTLKRSQSLLQGWVIVLSMTKLGYSCLLCPVWFVVLSWCQNMDVSSLHGWISHEMGAGLILIWNMGGEIPLYRKLEVPCPYTGTPQRHMVLKLNTTITTDMSAPT